MENFNKFKSKLISILLAGALFVVVFVISLVITIAGLRGLFIVVKGVTPVEATVSGIDITESYSLTDKKYHTYIDIYVDYVDFDGVEHTELLDFFNDTTTVRKGDVIPAYIENGNPSKIHGSALDQSKTLTPCTAGACLVSLLVILFVILPKLKPIFAELQSFVPYGRF